MRGYATVTAFLLLAAWTALAAQPQTLTISTNNTPLDRAALEGLSREAFHRIGVELRLIRLPSERSLRSADLGEIDGEGLRVAGLERLYANLVQVPERYIGISFVAFAKQPGIDLSAGWRGLASWRVAFITGWKLFETHATDARSVTKVDTPEQMFRMLDSGRVDLALYTLADGLALARGMKLEGIAPLSPALQDVDMYLYLNRRHLTLIPRLAEALRDMKADGTYQRILGSLSAGR